MEKKEGSVFRRRKGGARENLSLTAPCERALDYVWEKKPGVSRRAKQILSFRDKAHVVCRGEAWVPS